MMATVDFGLDPLTGDLAIDGTELLIVEGGDAVAQEVQVRLRWWLGGWFLDLSQGVPYLQEILRKGVTEAIVREVLRTQIELVPDVRSIDVLQVEIDRATREAEVTLELTSIDGEALALDAIPVGG
jgi:hypothetical protein